MGRWQPDSYGRLQEAALALFSERGFDQTTAAQIAARAGVTERTFFRHFADKREVLFGGSSILKERIVAAVAEAPATERPLDAVARGLDAAAAMLGESRRDLARQRQEVMAANPGLRERELSKLADYAAAVTATLEERGATRTEATGWRRRPEMTVFRLALQRWALQAEVDSELADVMRQAVADLRAGHRSGLTAAGPSTPPEGYRRLPPA